MDSGAIIIRRMRHRRFTAVPNNSFQQIDLEMSAVVGIASLLRSRRRNRALTEFRMIDYEERRTRCPNDSDGIQEDDWETDTEEPATPTSHGETPTTGSSQRHMGELDGTRMT